MPTLLVTMIFLQCLTHIPDVQTQYTLLVRVLLREVHSLQDVRLKVGVESKRGMSAWDSPGLAPGSGTRLLRSGGNYRILIKHALLSVFQHTLHAHLYLQKFQSASRSTSLHVPLVLFQRLLKSRPAFVVMIDDL